MPAKYSIKASPIPLNLVDTAIEKLDEDRIMTTITDAVVTMLLNSLEIDRIAGDIFKQQNEELQTQLVNAIATKWQQKHVATSKQ